LRNVLETYGSISELVIKKYLKYIIDGIIFLHQKEINIKNLKSSNILVELNGNIKLTDFLDYKSIIEFYEIYPNSNNKIRNSDKFLKHPYPWMLNFKNEMILENDYYLNRNIESEKYINVSFLAFLMLEMQTGYDKDFLKENFRLYNEGIYENENIKKKAFVFPSGVSDNFIDLFYTFFEENIKINFLKEIISNHKFFTS